MADAYSYRLLVELEENNIPRLKNKLVKYFQSRKSNGGDCEVEYESGSRTATLRFRTEEDQRNVLGKEVHRISLDKGVLKMTVRLPPDEKAAQESPPEKLNKKSELTTNNTQSSADDPTAAADVQTEEEEELCSTLAVIGNIPESFNRELLELLVENLLKDLRSSTASQGFTLEVLPAISSAVVTFQSEKGNTDWCTPNRMFTRMGLSVRPLEVTKQVVVEDIAKYNEDFLQMYFEKEGGDVENVLLNEVEQSAIITFKDHKAVQKALKKKHHIKQKELRVYPFYESLGTALYALFIGDNASKPQKEADFVIEAQKIDPACFHICGDSQTKVDSAKQWINDLFSKEYVTNTFSDYTILSPSDADHQCIVDMEKTMGVCIRAESKKSKTTITIEGFTKDVLKATTEIQDMLTKVRNEKELMKKVEVTGTLAEWQYQQRVNVASIYHYLNHGVM